MVERQVLEGAPSPESAALLLSVQVSALSADDAREVVLACEKLVRAAQAVQAEAIVAAAGPEPVPDPETDRLPLDEAAEWLAVDLGGSRQFQLARIDDARYLRAELPRTAAAMRAGTWGVYEAGLMIRAARSLTRRELIGRLEERIVPRGTFDLARRLRRAVARLDTAAVARKKQQAVSERSLRFWKDRFGTGSAGLTGSAPSQLMALVAAALDLDAQPRTDGDCRTIEMRRFDVLADWARQRLGLPVQDTAGSGEPACEPHGAAAAARSAAAALLSYARHHDPASADAGEDGPSGVAPPDSHSQVVPAYGHHDVAPPGNPVLHRTRRCSSCGRTGPPQLPISVTVSLDTLLGLSEEPADLAGWGLLDPETARTLAAEGTWRRWLCEPTTGHLLDTGATTYRPSDQLARFVRGRDRTCRWPNCHQPAVRCDLDHTEPFEHGGATTRANLTPLCRRHHRHKHETDAGYERLPNGATRWKDPSGRIHTRPAERHHTDWTDWEGADPDQSELGRSKADQAPTGPSDGEEEPECPF